MLHNLTTELRLVFFLIIASICFAVVVNDYWYI